MTARALLLAAALLGQEPEPSQPMQPLDMDGAYGWRCWARVEIGPYQGSVWRDYGKELPHSAYMMQAEPTGRDDRLTMTWTIDPRPEGPPPGKKRIWPFAAREAAAFRNGPTTVVLAFKWEPRALAGPLWVQFWGDGTYAGTQMMMSARSLRRHYGKDRPVPGLGTGVSVALVAKLAAARTWTAVAVDGTGRRLASETFVMPTPPEAEAAYRNARSRIDSLERRFAVDHEPWEDDREGCADHEDPAASI